MRHSLAFRLTLWYAIFFIFSVAIGFLLFYMLIAAMIQQRTDDVLLSQSNEFRAIYRIQGIIMLQRSALLQAQASGEKKMFYRLFYPSGVVFSSSNMTYWKEIGIDRRAVETVLSDNRHVFVTQRMPDGKYKARVIYARIGSSVMLQLGYALEDEGRLLQAFKQLFMLTTTALLLLAIMGGWFMARRALSGVAMLTRTAQQISDQDLDTRVPVRQRHNEIDLLAITFNQMLDRVRALVTGIRQMNDNIAHDLRSPITRIRGLAEVTLTGQSDEEDYRQMAASTIEECDRLLDMTNTMLTISRTESGVNPLERNDVDFSAITKDACELFGPLAEDKDLTLRPQVADGLRVRGDQRLLQRMVGNLIDNAIKYTEPGGHIIVALTPGAEDRIVLTVKDSGIGVSEADQSKVFDRFFRGDQSRSQAGAGLGLSLVQTIVRAHNGSIELQSVPRKGAVFTVNLPAAPDQKNA